MKIFCCFMLFFALFLSIFRTIENSDTLRLLYPSYKLIEDAVMGNPEVKFLLRQAFFPSTNYRYWQVDGAEIIPISICVTLHNNTEEESGIECSLTENDEVTNCTLLWSFHWTNSLLMNIIPGDILLAMDSTFTTIMYSAIIKSSLFRWVTLNVHLSSLSIHSLDDIEQAFVLFLSTVSKITMQTNYILTLSLLRRVKYKYHQTWIHSIKVT